MASADGESSNGEEISESGKPLSQMSFSAFVTELFLHDLQARCGKQKDCVEITTAKPRKLEIQECMSLPENTQKSLMSYAEAKRTLHHFRVAKAKCEKELQTSLASTEMVLKKHLRTEEEAFESSPHEVTLPNSEGNPEVHVLFRGMRPKPTRSPCLRDTRVIITQAVEDTVQSFKPELAMLPVSETNQAEVLKTVLDSGFVTLLLEHLSTEYQKYKMSKRQLQETVVCMPKSQWEKQKNRRQRTATGEVTSAT